jgi:hypothetical protein
MGVSPYLRLIYGPKYGAKIRGQNTGPKYGAKIRGQNMGPKYGAKIRGQNTGPKYGAKTSFGGLRGAPPPYLWGQTTGPDSGDTPYWGLRGIPLAKTSFRGLRGGNAPGLN